MTYDRRVTASQFDRRVKEAQSKAKAHWGAGWSNLSQDMQEGAICREFVASLAAIDFGAAFEGRLDQEGMAEKLLQRLEDISAAALKASRL